MTGGGRYATTQEQFATRKGDILLHAKMTREREQYHPQIAGFENRLSVKAVYTREIAYNG
jgi:hypothetical protein